MTLHKNLNLTLFLVVSAFEKSVISVHLSVSAHFIPPDISAHTYSITQQHAKCAGSPLACHRR